MDAVPLKELRAAILDPNANQEVPALSEEDVCRIATTLKKGSVIFQGNNVSITTYLNEDGSDGVVSMEVGGFNLDTALLIRDGFFMKATVDVTSEARRSDWLQRMMGKYMLRPQGRKSYFDGGTLVIENSYANGLKPPYGVEINISYSKLLCKPQKRKPARPKAAKAL